MRIIGHAIYCALVLGGFVGVCGTYDIVRASGAREERLRIEDSAKLNLSHSTSFVVFPQDCNANPPMLFGGKLLAEMDRCAGITTRRFLYASPTGAKDAVTLAINSVTFHKGAEVKDLIFITGTVIKVGNKTVTIKVAAEREVATGRELLVDGEFVFCAFDLIAKKGIAHGITIKE